MDALSEAIREACMLARVSLHAFRGNRTDKSAGEEIAQQKGAIHGAASVRVKLLAGCDTLVKALLAEQRAAKDLLLAHSMRYADEEWRLMPNTKFMPFMQGLAPIQRQHEALKAKLRQEAPALLAQARVNLGSLDVPLPDEDELVDSFKIDYQFQPVPDWRGAERLGLDRSVIDRLTKVQDARVQAAYDTAIADTMERVLKPLEAFTTAMKRFNERELALSRGEDIGRTGFFKDTAVTNLRDIAASLDAFNVCNDQRLTDLKNMVESLASAEPDALRDNINLREASIDKAESVATTLRSWLNPGVFNAAPGSAAA